MDYRPAYMRIVEDIQQDIEKGIYKVGECIPTQAQLAEKYGVSRITVRDAMLELSHRGFLYTRQGKGTFVAEKKKEYAYPSVRSRSFSNELKQAGFEITTKVLSLKRCIADDELCSKFAMEEGMPLIRLSRLRIVGGMETLVTTSYLDADRFKEIDFFKIDFRVKSLYETLVSRTGLVIASSEEEFRAEACPPDMADILNFTAGRPVIHVKRYTFDDQYKCFEWCEQYERTDRFSIKVRSENH